MEISYQHHRNLYSTGFTIFQNIIPKEFSKQALKHINSNLSKIDMCSEGICYDFMTNINRDPQIMDLFYKTPIKEITDSLVGRDQYDAIDISQIGLNFPVEEKPSRDLTWHLDGMYESTKGAEKKPWNFTMLIGVFLSDMPEPGHGNFTVYPKGHQILAEYFRNHGTDALFQNELDDLVEMKESIIGKTGDVIICHPQLPHLGDPVNLSPYIRYLVFFRINRKGRSFFNEKALTDLFIEWDGMRNFEPNKIEECQDKLPEEDIIISK